MLARKPRLFPSKAPSLALNVFGPRSRQYNVAATGHISKLRREDPRFASRVCAGSHRYDCIGATIAA